MSETDLVQERYQRRGERNVGRLYSPLQPAVYLSAQERQRALIRWIRVCNMAPVAEKRVLEVGCGGGNNLLELMLLGFAPENLVGNELLEDRVLRARLRLPAAVEVIPGDASELPLECGPFDIIYQSTVFTSLLDDGFQQKLAQRMWALLRPGGGILWYDFIYNNPQNPDVRGMKLADIERLFPEGKIRAWRVTLAPPISRRITKLHPALYGVCNTLPFLRTHLLCWIEKRKP